MAIQVECQCQLLLALYDALQHVEQCCAADNPDSTCIAMCSSPSLSATVVLAECTLRYIAVVA